MASYVWWGFYQLMLQLLLCFWSFSIHPSMSVGASEDFTNSTTKCLIGEVNKTEKMTESVWSVYETGRRPTCSRKTERKRHTQKKTNVWVQKNMGARVHTHSHMMACKAPACIYLRLHLHILLGFDTGRKVRLNDMLGETETRGRREAGWQRGGKYQRGEEDRQITREEKD